MKKNKFDFEKVEKIRAKMRARKYARCPACGKIHLDGKKWGDTGFTPTDHIRVQGCEHTGALVSEKAIYRLAVAEFEVYIHHLCDRVAWDAEDELVRVVRGSRQGATEVLRKAEWYWSLGKNVPSDWHC